MVPVSYHIFLMMYVMSPCLGCFEASVLVASVLTDFCVVKWEIPLLASARPGMKPVSTSVSPPPVSMRRTNDRIAAFAENCA